MIAIKIYNNLINKMSYQTIVIHNNKGNMIFIFIHYLLIL